MKAIKFVIKYFRGNQKPMAQLIAIDFFYIQDLQDDHMDVTMLGLRVRDACGKCNENENFRSFGIILVVAVVFVSILNW